MKGIVMLFVALALTATTIAKTFNRCSLAREMSMLGVPRNQLARWACIAEYESSFRTGMIGPLNWDGSNDYGIFQINNYYWCQPADGSFSYNECRISCNDLLSDNIIHSVICAHKVLSQQGWFAWSSWRYCIGILPSIDDCF